MQVEVLGIAMYGIEIELGFGKNPDIIHGNYTEMI